MPPVPKKGKCSVIQQAAVLGGRLARVRYAPIAIKIPLRSEMMRWAIGLRLACELAVELGKQRDAVGEPNLRTRRGQRKILRGGRAIDDEARARQRLERRREGGIAHPVHAPTLAVHAAPARWWNRRPRRSARPARSWYRSRRANRMREQTHLEWCRFRCRSVCGSSAPGSPRRVRHRHTASRSDSRPPAARRSSAR
jgi:hypothetical protein